MLTAVAQFRELCFARVARPVAIVHTFSVALHRVVTINDWVLAGEVWLGEVMFVLDVCPSHPRLDDDWSIGANEEGKSCFTLRRGELYII